MRDQHCSHRGAIEPVSTRVASLIPLRRLLEVGARSRSPSPSAPRFVRAARFPRWKRMILRAGDVERAVLAAGRLQRRCARRNPSAIAARRLGSMLRSSWENTIVSPDQRKLRQRGALAHERASLRPFRSPARDERFAPQTLGNFIPQGDARVVMVDQGAQLA